MQCTKCRQSMRDMGTTPATLDKTFYCSDCQAYRQRLPLKSMANDLTQTAIYTAAATKLHRRDQISAMLNNVFQF